MGKGLASETCVKRLTRKIADWGGVGMIEAVAAALAPPANAGARRSVEPLDDALAGHPGAMLKAAKAAQLLVTMCVL